MPAQARGGQAPKLLRATRKRLLENDKQGGGEGELVV